MRSKAWVFITVLVLMLSCSLPSGAVPEDTATIAPSGANVDVAGTSVELTTVVRLTELAGAVTVVPVSATTTVTPSVTPTPCAPTVMAAMDANIRSGPGTMYEIISFLPLNGTTTVTGRNDANTWWYIVLPGNTTNYGWIAGSVVTTSCLPASVQVVAAPPTPTPTPTPTYTEVPATYPDLYVSEYTWSPSPPHKGVSFHVRVGAYNAGNAPAGPFTVEWWLSTSAPAPACTWNIPSMAAKGGRILECDYTTAGWANYPSQVVVDSGDTLEESDEGNNVWAKTLQIAP